MIKNLLFQFLFLFCCLVAGIATANAQNNACSSAINLSVGQLVCNYTLQNNNGTTPDTGVPAPSCAGYVEEDTWFQFTVPASGNVKIDMQTGTITDMGMALYSGTCGALTPIACDDDSSPNGLMPMINASGLTAGTTLYVRVWEFGGDTQGTFSICVQDNNPVSTCGQTCTGPAPANDICSGAFNLGALPAPPPCSSGGGTGAIVTAPAAVSSNLCATAGNPYTFISSCIVGGGQDNPAADVWFSFTATSTDLVLNLTSSMQGANVAIYAGSCTNLIGFGCVSSNTGNITQTFSPLSPGTVYYLQVSGSTPNDRCNFSLNLRNNRNCSYCIQQSTLVVDPLPGTGAAPTGTYLPGTTVEFCYTIQQYNQTASVNVNWLHGVVPQLGPGWDPSTLTPISDPNSCSGSGGGNWNWYTSVTGTGGAAITTGPGFFYDANSGGGSLNGNPGDNWGDPGNCSWTFCWEVTSDPAAQCIPSNDLNLTVAVYPDSQTGSWTQPGCQQDPDYPFYANPSCCDLLVTMGGGGYGCSGTPVPVSIAFDDTNYPSGPWTFTYTNNGASPVTVTTTTNPYTFNATLAGVYQVQSASNPDCVTGGSGQANVSYLPNVAAQFIPPLNVCAGSNLSVTGTGAAASFTLTYTNTTTGIATTINTTSFPYVITAPPPGNYVLNSITANAGALSCPGTISGSPANVINAPVANAGPDQSVCSLTATLAGNAVTAPATGTWALVTTPPAPGTASFAPNANAANATVTVSAPGTYTFRWTTAQGACSTNDLVTITFSQPTANAGPDQSAVCGLTATLAGNTPVAPFTGQWAQTGGPGSSSFSAGTTPNSNVSVTVPGTYTFQWQVGNGTCSVSDVVSLTFINTTPNAGADQSAVCGLTATLAGNAPSAPATGVWTQVSGGGTATFVNNAANNSGVTVTQAGTYTFQWTVTNGVCTSNDQVSVTFIVPTSNAGPDQSAICGLTATLAATAVAAPATGQWSQTAGPGTSTFSNAASPTSGVTVTQSGNYTFTWTVTNSTCTATDNINATFNAPPTATISGGGAICNDGISSATISIALSGTAPFTFTYNNGSSPTTVTAYSGANPYTFNTVQAGNYTITSISDASGCVGSGSGTASVTSNALPTAAISGSTTICTGSNTNLSFALTGAAPFTLVYTDGTVNYTINNATNPATATVSPTATTTYSIVSVTGNNGCTNTGSGTATVTINPAPQVNFATLATPCDGTGNFYTVNFSITGGNGTYIVTPAGGTVVGGSYTSAQIPSGTAYSFTVDDSNGCNPVVVSGTYTCGCNTAAGQMQIPATVPVQVCSSQPASGVHVAGSETLDADDTFMYVLHTNVGASIGGTPIATNATGIFAFNAATMTYGTTYYISYVAGDQQTPNNVDLSDNCLSVAPGVPIVWIQPPTASTGTPITTCGLTATLSANTPLAGMVGTWTTPSPNITFANANDPNTGITASAPGSYTLTWTVTNAPCTAATATQTATFAAAPTLAAGADVCDFNTETTDLPLTVSGGTAPYTVSASGGIALSGSGTNYSANDIPNGTTFTVTVSDANSCTASASFGPFNCACPFVPAPENPVGSLFCPGGMPGQLSVDAVGAGYTIQWYSPGSGTTAVATGTTYTPTMGGIYFVDVVDDVTGCKSPQLTVLAQLSTAVNIAQQPTQCAPDLSSYSVQITVTGGVAPYTLSANSGTVTDLGGGVFTVSGVAEGTNIALTATDNNTCTATANVTSPNCDCAAIAAPTAAGVSYCNGGTPPPISVSGVPAGFSVEWYDAATGGNLISTDNPFSPATSGTYYAQLVQTVNGCTSPRTAVAVTENAPIGVLAGTGTCSSDLQTYDLTVSISGGAQPYSVSEANGYIVSGSGTTFTINDVPIGLGTSINVIDANNCSGSGTGNSPVCTCPDVPEPVPSNNSYCNGASVSNLSIAAPPAGYTAIWYSDAAGTNQLATGNTLLPTGAGTYYVALQDDANSCLSDLVAATLTENPAIVFTDGGSTCAANLQTYSFNFTISGGTPPYTVSTSSGTQSGAAGSYSVAAVPIGESVTINVTDNNGCTLPSQLVTPPTCPCPAIPAPTAVDADVSFCAGSLPPALTVNDPGAGYIVYWFNTPVGGSAIETGTDYQPGGQGTFYAEVGLSINACRSPRTAFTVTQNALPTIAIGLPACAADLESYQVDITITGATPIVVTAAAPATVTPVSATVFTIAGIPSNLTNSVTATDANGCATTIAVGPQNCDCPIINAPSDPVGNVFCFGETETVLAVDPAPAGYEIVWYNSFLSDIPLGTGPTFTPTGMGAGTYYAAVEDITADCVSLRTEVILTMNTPIAPTFSGLLAQYCATAPAVTLAGTASPAGGTFTINGAAATTLNPATLGAGSHVLSYTYTNSSGCEASGTFNFQILSPVATPVVNCGATTTSTVTFTWGAVAGAASYDIAVAINGGTPASQNTATTSYTQSGLLAGDIVTISVIAVGNAACGNSAAGTATCAASGCPPLTPTINNVLPTYCSDEFPFNLAATPTGGTWSGTGVVGGNVFNPLLANPGVNVISYNYTDPATGCDYSATASTTVSVALAQPTITCSSTVNSVTFDWTNLGAGITYDLTIQINGGATLSQNNLPNATYTQLGLSDGDAVSITVIANGVAPCGDSPTATSSCTAQNCPAVAVTINGLAASYCADDAPITLSGTPAGGTFTGNGVTGVLNDQFDPSLVGAPTTTVVYTYADANGCQYQAQQTINIAPPLATPVVSCGAVTTNAVTFNWTNIGVTTYNVSVSINGGAPIAAVANTTTYTQNGLSAGDQVAISVIGVGTAPCGNSAAGTQTCTAQNCPTITPTINVNTEYCRNSAVVTLTALPAGGTFSGPGVTGTQFDPSAVPAGLVTITYNYTDPATNCSYTATADVNIVAPLNAPSVSCLGSTTNSATFEWTNLGAASYELSISVNGGTPTTQGVAATTYTVNGLSVNDIVTVSVVAIGTAPCGNGPAGTGTCTAQDCPAQTLTINGLAAQYCSDDAIVTLSATPAGGTFSGTGITGNQFNPATAGTGVVTVVYNYTDPATDCDYQYQTSTNVSTPLATPVVSCGIATSSSVTFTWTDLGVAQYEVTYSINGGLTTTETVLTPQLILTGLLPNDVADISVVAVGVAPCGNSAAGTGTCTAQDCSPLTPTIDGLASSYCADDAAFILNGTPAGGVWSGTGVAGNQFNPATAGAGTFAVTYTYTDPATTCQYVATSNVTVIAPLNVPTILCASTTVNSVTFTWNNVGATDYTVTADVNGVPGVPFTIANTTYTQNGLTEGNSVTLTVVANGGAPCGSTTAATQTCTAQDCPPQTLTIDGLAAAYCTDDAVVTLSATPAGGTFSGDGVTGGQFDPAAAGLGNASITYTYIDAATGCSYSTVVDVPVSAPLAVPVVSCGAATTSSVGFTWTDVGAASYELSISINGGAATTQTATTTSYTASGLVVGDEVTIIVTALGAGVCGNGAASAAVTCEAQDCPPGTPTINLATTEFCSDAAAVALTANPAGGTWSGTGVSGSNFDPAAAGVGTDTITYDYIDAVTGCAYNATIEVSVVAPLPVPVVSCGTTSTTSVEFTWTGDAAATYTVSISVNGGTATTASVLGTSYTATGLSVGDQVTATVTAIAGAGDVCGDSAASAAVTCTANDCPALTLEITVADTLYCTSDAAAALTAIPTGGTWSGNGVNAESFNPATAGAGTHNLIYTYTDPANGCVYSDTLSVSVSSVVVDPIATVTVEPGTEVTLSADATSSLDGVLTIAWTDASGTALNNPTATNPVVAPTATAVYTVTATDEFGCSDTNTATVNIVVVAKANAATMPTAFSPNGDGQHDIFSIQGANIASIELAVFNRWGQQMYHLNTAGGAGSIGLGWDGKYEGKDMEIGVYVYYVRIVYNDGEENTLKGNVTLVR